MKLYNLDSREIRSFRLRHKTLELKSFFENKKSSGLFMMTETLQPKKRIEERKNLQEQNLIITNISKKIGRFLTKEKNWSSIQNLLNGNVVLIKNKEGAPLSPININYLLKQPTSSARFLFWNQNIYREKALVKYTQTTTSNQHIILNSLIKKIYLTPLLLINPFIRRNNKGGYKP